MDVAVFLKMCFEGRLHGWFQVIVKERKLGIPLLIRSCPVRNLIREFEDLVIMCSGFLALLVA